MISTVYMNIRTCYELIMIIRTNSNPFEFLGSLFTISKDIFLHVSHTCILTDI
jgi:hypothetical protein